MKLSTLLMIMVALQFTLMMFGIGIESTPLILFVTNPVDWTGLGFINFFLGTAGIVTAAVIVGSLVFGKNDTAIFASAVAFLIGCCVPIFTLWNTIKSEVGYFGSSCVTVGSISNPFSMCSNIWIASVAVSPLAILSIITILNWWRSASDIS